MKRLETVGQEAAAVQAVAKLAVVLAMLVLVPAGRVLAPCSLVPVAVPGPVVVVLPPEPWRGKAGRRGWPA